LISVKCRPGLGRSTADNDANLTQRPEEGDW
jgi:hypothetical protein